MVAAVGLNNRRWPSEAWAPAAGSVSNVGKPDLLRVSKFNNVEWRRSWADRRDFKANSQQARSSDNGGTRDWIATRAEVGKDLLVRHQASIQPEENKEHARRKNELRCLFVARLLYRS